MLRPFSIKYISALLLLFVSVELQSQSYEFVKYSNAHSLLRAVAEGKCKPMLESGNTLKTRINWDENKNLDSVLRKTSYYDVQKNQYAELIKDKSYLMFDSKENTFTLMYFKYDTANNTWYTASKYIEYYTANAILLKTASFSYEKTTNSWLPTSISNITTNKDSIISTYQTFDLEHSTWVNSSRTIHTSTNLGKFMTEQWDQWNEDSQTWEIYYHKYFTYDDYGKEVENGVLHFTNLSGTTDTVGFITKYEYDGAGNLSVEKKYKYLINTDPQLTSSTHYFDYNTQGKPAFKIDSALISGTNVFSETYRHIHSYPADNLTDSTIVYKWDSEKEKSILYAHFTNTYNADGDLLRDSKYHFNELGDTMHYEHYRLSYNKPGEIDHEKYVIWNYGQVSEEVAYDNTYFFPIHTENIETSGTSISIRFNDYLVHGDAMGKIDIQYQYANIIGSAYIPDYEPDKIVIELEQFPNDGEKLTITENENLLTNNGRIARFTVSIGNNMPVNIPSNMSNNKQITYSSICREHLVLTSETAVTSWRIINIYGSIIAEERMLSVHQLDINLQNIVSGAYYIALQLQSGNTEICPFIKE